MFLGSYDEGVEENLLRDDTPLAKIGVEKTTQTGSSVYPRVEKVVCEVGSLAQPIEKDSSLSNFSPI